VVEKKRNSEIKKKEEGSTSGASLQHLLKNVVRRPGSDFYKGCIAKPLPDFQPEDTGGNQGREVKWKKKKGKSRGKARSHMAKKLASTRKKRFLPSRNRGEVLSKKKKR